MRQRDAQHAEHNRVERREVTLGIQSANHLQILSGLREGEMVVFGGQSRFRSNQLVKPQLVTPAKAERVE